MRSLHAGRPGLILFPEFRPETWAMLEFIQALLTAGKDKRRPIFCYEQW